MFINAISSDSTYGFVYDSLMAEYNSRVLKDITALDTAFGGQQKRAEYNIEENLSKKPILNEDKEPELLQNIPNPFSEGTLINFKIYKESDVQLKIYDLNGREIETMMDQRLKRGNYISTFNRSDISPGVYLCVLTVDGIRYMNKMSYIK